MKRPTPFLDKYGGRVVSLRTDDGLLLKGTLDDEDWAFVYLKDVKIIPPGKKRAKYHPAAAVRKLFISNLVVESDGSEE
jgi:small nuclear ribonucleoprotein (snRNP)-like protein